MEIIVKTAAYATNKNVSTIIGELRKKGFEANVRTWPKDGVAIITDAPKSALQDINYTRSAVSFTGV